MKVEIRVEIHWQCPQCGRQHKEIVALGRPLAAGATDVAGLNHKLECPECGQATTVSISLAELARLAMDAGTAEGLEEEHTDLLARLAHSARTPSAN